MALRINAETTSEQRSADAQQLRQRRCQDKAEQDAAFRQRMAGKFRFTAGLLTLRTLDDLSAQADEILAHVARLEQRIAIR